MPAKMRVVSGIQPTGDLHLGNLLGAILRWVRMQDEAECLFFLADLHALTVDVDPAQLAKSVREMAAALIASGIDPNKSIVFRQSAIPAHAELAWILQGTARMGWLNRMTQWKDKAGKDREGKSVGLFTYPVLQAADILLYQATHVPVGEDQKQHVELTRDIAAKFNNDFAKSIMEHQLPKDYFPITEPVITGPATRVMSLKDASKKMSKSDPSPQASVLLMDDTDTISKKFKRATTDPEPLPTEEKGLEGRAEADNLVGIYAALANVSKADVLKQFGGQGWGVFKPALADLAVAELAPIAAETRRMVADPAYVDGFMRDGAERAAVMAERTMTEVRNIVGFIR